MKKFKAAFVLILVLPLLFVAAATRAQEPVPRQLVRLQIAEFDPLVDGEPLPALDASEDAAGGPYYILQFSGPVDETAIQQVEQLGVDLLGYIPDNAHLARIEPESLERVRSLATVRWVGAYRAEYKASPELKRGSQAGASAQISLHVVGFPGEPPGELAGQRICAVSEPRSTSRRRLRWAHSTGSRSRRRSCPAWSATRR
jgi:hypothetical protein